MSDLSDDKCDPETNLSEVIPKIEILELVRKLPEGWEIKDGELQKTFELPSFHAAVLFLNSICAVAEIQDHHPRLTLDYNTIHFSLTTHETRKTKERGITLCDFIFAAKTERILKNMGL